MIATAHATIMRAVSASQYCAWHSSTSSISGNIAYTNLPYMTDAGASCGANFNGLGSNAGITIVDGHELAETITDQFPNGGWLDSGGEENGDKCAWISSGQGASADVKLTTGTFPVQSLWSNAYNGGAGGWFCRIEKAERCREGGQVAALLVYGKNSPQGLKPGCYELVGTTKVVPFQNNLERVLQQAKVGRVAALLVCGGALVLLSANAVCDHN